MLKLWVIWYCMVKSWFKCKGSSTFNALKQQRLTVNASFMHVWKCLCVW